MTTRELLYIKTIAELGFRATFCMAQPRERMEQTIETSFLDLPNKHRACPQRRGFATLSRARSHDCATAYEQAHAVCSHAHFAYAKKTPLLSKRCNIHGSTQLLQESQCAPCSLCMITTAAVQGYPQMRSPVRSEMHFTKRSCRNCFQPVTVPLCCLPSQLLFSSLRFSTFFIICRECEICQGGKISLLPPLPLPRLDKLPSLPTYHRTTSDSFSPYGSP